MTRNKKIVVLFVVLTLLFSVTAFAAEDKTISREEAVSQIVKSIYQNFPLEENYCLHASTYAHYTGEHKEYPVLCVIYESVPPCGFSDVTSETKNALSITLAKAMGIIDGYPDKSFRPDQATTFNEAVKLCVAAVGYSPFMDEAKTYPENYLEEAESLLLTEGLIVEGNKTISERDFEKLLQNTLDFKGITGNLMLTFVTPATAEECVKAYCEAVMHRRGALQYALFDHLLREQIRKDFESVFWTTGASSPFVTSYEITKVAENSYSVIFHYQTSTGPADNETVSLKVQQENDRYFITALK